MSRYVRAGVTRVTLKYQIFRQQQQHNSTSQKRQYTIAMSPTSSADDTMKKKANFVEGRFAVKEIAFTHSTETESNSTVSAFLVRPLRV